MPVPNGGGWDDWARWSGDPGINGRAEYLPNDAAVGWRVLYGEVLDNRGMELLTASGLRPMLYIVGRAWAAEWTGPAEDVALRRGESEVTVPLSRPWHGLR